MEITQTRKDRSVLSVLNRLSANKWTFITIILVALTLRIVYALLAPSVDPFLQENPLYGDAFDYHHLAKNFYQGEGFTVNNAEPTSFRAPFFPMVLGVFYVIFGTSYEVARLSQAFIGTALVIVTYFIGKRAGSSLIAVIAAAIVAIYPVTIYVGSWIMTEPLYLLLSTASMYFVYVGCERQKKGLVQFIIAGILLGLSGLTRPQGLVLAPLFALIIFLNIYRSSLRQAGWQLFVFTLVTTATVLPWTIRNYTIHDELVLIDTHGGYTFFGSYVPSAKGSFRDRPLEELAHLSEPARDHEYYSMTFEWIKEHPNETLEMIPLRLWRITSPITTVGGTLDIVGAPIIHFFHLIFLMVAVVGGYLAIQANRINWVLWCPIVMTIFITIVFYGTARFAVMMTPSVAVFWGIAVDYYFRYLNGNDKDKIGVAGKGEGS